MSIIQKIKRKFEAINPLAIVRRNKMQSQLKNNKISFLTPNCLGGILFHDLGLEFCSPTVNLMMTQTDFVKFVCNMEMYLNKEFVFYKDPNYSCPCAFLGDIVIHFTHYNTEEQAEYKWNERAKRIDYNNLFIFAEERDGLTKEEILSLGNIPAKGIVVFTAHDYPDIPYTVYLSKYRQGGEVGNILARNYWNDSREYEQYFDFVKWFNEAAGGDFDVTAFKK